MIKRNFFVKWFETNGRSFPWREEGTTPFNFLVTEMLLRQTRAQNVARLWTNFVTDYPTPPTIVNENKEILFSKIQILGFANQRVEALQSASQWLLEKYNGIVPNKLELLLLIPHIGNYSARAVLCFAFNQKIEIVDTNVLRLFSRYFGITLKPDIRRAPVAWEIAKELLPKDKNKAQFHNYGMLDFTAQICKSGRPRCEICPLNKSCQWGQVQIGVTR